MISFQFYSKVKYAIYWFSSKSIYFAILKLTSICIIKNKFTFIFKHVKSNVNILNILSLFLGQFITIQNSDTMYFFFTDSVNHTSIPVFDIQNLILILIWIISQLYTSQFIV